MGFQTDLNYNLSHNIQIHINSSDHMKTTSTQNLNYWGKGRSNIEEEGLNEIRDLVERDQTHRCVHHPSVKQTIFILCLTFHFTPVDLVTIVFFYFRIYWISMKENSDA